MIGTDGKFLYLSIVMAEFLNLVSTVETRFLTLYDSRSNYRLKNNEQEIRCPGWKFFEKLPVLEYRIIGESE